MAKPVKKGPMIPVRLSLSAHAVLEARAAKARLSPREHLVAQLEKSLGSMERNEVTVTGEAATLVDRTAKLDPGKFLEVDTVVPLGPESELVVPEAFQEPSDEELARSQEVKYGPHPSWRCNAIGMNVCTVCGEPKVSARKLCPGSPL